MIFLCSSLRVAHQRQIIKLQRPAGPSPQKTRLKFKAHQGLRGTSTLPWTRAARRHCTSLEMISRSSQSCLEKKARQKMSHNLWKPKAKHNSRKALWKYGGKTSFALLWPKSELRIKDTCTSAASHVHASCRLVLHSSNRRFPWPSCVSPLETCWVCWQVQQSLWAVSNV